MEPKSVDASTPQPSLEFQKLPVHRIYTSPHQMRKVFEPTALKDLADSMKREGLLQPISVRPVGESWELIAGERRLRAAQLLGWEVIAARIMPANDEAAAVNGLIENLQRADLNVMEEAHSYRQLIQTPYLMTPQAIAERVGRSPLCIARALALLDLPHEVQAVLSRGGLTETHARVLRRLPERGHQVTFALRAEREGWAVKEMEKQVDLWLAANGHANDRRTDERRHGRGLVPDPLGHLWQTLQTSLNGHPTKCAVQYQGKNRWIVNIRAEAETSQRDLAALFLKMGTLLRQASPGKQPRAKRRAGARPKKR